MYNDVHRSAREFDKQIGGCKKWVHVIIYYIGSGFWISFTN